MAEMRESLKAKRARARAIYKQLKKEYPGVRCTLDYKNPLQLLIMTILAAQCTDERVNIIAKDLFRKFRTAADFAEAVPETLETVIRSAGFYRQKAKSIIKTCRDIVDKHGGRVPHTMEELTALRGVGRKTANVILGECFGGQGVIVDTHCTRLARRLGFTKESDAKKIEDALMKIWPEETWTLFSHFMVFHGRAVCTARAPKCSRCTLRDRCPFPDTREGKKIAR
jgi:endonuclease III